MVQARRTLTIAGVILSSLALITGAQASGLAVTVRVGPSTTGSHPVTAASTTSHQLRLDAGSAAWTCVAVSAPSSGSRANAGSSVVDIVTFGELRPSSCTGAFGNWTFQPLAPTTFHATGGVSSGSSDVIAGHLDAVRYRAYTTSDPSVCDFEFAGRVSATLNEASQVLTLLQPDSSSSPLTVVKVTKACLGRVAVGDPFGWTGSLRITSSDGATRVG